MKQTIVVTRDAERGNFKCDSYALEEIVVPDENHTVTSEFDVKMMLIVTFGMTETEVDGAIERLTTGLEQAFETDWYDDISRVIFDCVDPRDYGNELQIICEEQDGVTFMNPLYVDLLLASLHIPRGNKSFNLNFYTNITL